MMRFISIFILNILLITSAQTSSKLIVSPVDFPNGDGVLIAAFNDRFKNTANESNLFSVIVGVDSLANKACNDIPCLIEKGKASGADQILYCSINGFGTLYTVTARLIKIEDGSVIVSVTEDFHGTPEEFLVAAPKKVVESISLKLKASQSSTLKVTTSPDGADLIIGNVKKGITPFTGTFTESGSYALTIQKAGYNQILDTILMVSGKEVAKNYTLAHSNAWFDSVSIARKDSIFQVANRSMRTSLPEALTQLTIPLGGREGLRIAVIPFEAPDSLADARKMSSEYAVNYLVSQPGITVVDRDNFKKVYDELQLSQSNLISEKSALEMGKMLSANYILTGTVSSFSKKQTVFMRLINTETTEITTAASAQLNQEMTDQLIKDVLGEKMKPSAAAFRSLVVPGWGQSFTGHKGHAIVSATLVAAGIGASTYLGFDLKKQEEQLNKYITKDPSTIIDGDSPASWAERAETVEQARNDAAQLFTYVLIGTGGLWVANVIDAFVLGSIESKKVKKMYFSAIPSQNRQVALAAGFSVNF